QGACVPDWCFPLAVQGPDRWLLSPSCLSSPFSRRKRRRTPDTTGWRRLRQCPARATGAARDKTQRAKLRLAAVIFIYKVPSVKPDRSNHSMRPACDTAACPLRRYGCPTCRREAVHILIHRAKSVSCFHPAGDGFVTVWWRSGVSPLGMAEPLVVE